MSYLDPSQDEELQAAQQGSQSPAGSNPNAAPSSASGVGDTGATSGATKSYSAAAPTSGTQGTGFQNLQSYLDANQNNQLANQVAGKIGDQATQARSDLNTAQTGFQDSVNKNTVKENDGNVNGVIADPTNASDSDKSAFQAQLNANYGGPKSSSQYGDYQKATSEGQNAYNAAQAAKSQGGQYSLLNQYFGNAGYNNGQKALDSALFTGGDQTALNNVQNDVQNMPAQFQKTGTDLDALANTGATTTAATRANARKQLGVDDAGNLTQQTDGATTNEYGQPIYTGAIGGIENAVYDKVGAYNSSAQANYQAIKTALANKDLTGLTSDQLATLGSLSSYNGSLYGVDPSKFLTENAANATPNTAISKADQTKLQALYDLAGVKNTFAPDAALAETAPTTPYTYDNGAFGNAVEAGSAAYQNALNQAVQYQDPLSAPQGSGSLKIGGGTATADLPTAIKNVQNDLYTATSGKAGASYNQAALVQQLQQQLQALNDQKNALDTKYGAINDYLNNGSNVIRGGGSKTGGQIR